jgi:lysozyme
MSAITLAIEKLIKPYEGYAIKLPDGSCKAYPDPGTGNKPYTIGYGSTGPDITPTTQWTLAQAESRLAKHTESFAVAVVKLSPTLLQEENKLAAIISFTYNCGLGNYRISTLKKRIDARDWLGAASEIVKWNKANGKIMRGLTLRRMSEATLLRS